MKLSKICDILDFNLKKETAEPWDNVGLLVGNKCSEIHKVLISLELTKELFEYGKTEGYDLIITHHPAIFQPMKSVTMEDGEFNLVYELIQNNMAVYSSHTNFDMLEDTMDTHIANALGGINIESIKDCPYGIIFDIEKVEVGNLAESVIQNLDLPDLKIIGNTDKVVNKVAVITGSGSDMYKEAFESGADIFITGDIKYHMAQDLKNEGKTAFDIGHYGSEKVFAKVFIEKFGHLLEGMVVKEYPNTQDPFLTIIRR